MSLEEKEGVGRGGFREKTRAKNGDAASQTLKNPHLSFSLSEQRKLSYSLVAYRDESAGLQKVVRDKVETVLEVLPNVGFLKFLKD